MAPSLLHRVWGEILPATVDASFGITLAANFAVAASLVARRCDAETERARILRGSCALIGCSAAAMLRTLCCGPPPSQYGRHAGRVTVQLTGAWAPLPGQQRREASDAGAALRGIGVEIDGLVVVKVEAGGQGARDGVVRGMRLAAVAGRRVRDGAAAAAAYARAAAASAAGGGGVGVVFAPAPGPDGDAGMAPGRIAWVMFEAPCLIVPALQLRAAGGDAGTPPGRALLGAFCAHYAHRALVWPVMLRDPKPWPWPTVVFAGLFTGANSYFQAAWLLRHCGRGEPASLLSPRCAAGLAIFACGAATNVWADYTLMALRGRGGRRYNIPAGGAFEYVSGANYLGEIVEWSGWALACGTVPAWSFAAMTAANTIPRALQNHATYIEEFGDDYPPARKAVIPFLL